MALYPAPHSFGTIKWTIIIVVILDAAPKTIPPLHNSYSIAPQSIYHRLRSQRPKRQCFLQDLLGEICLARKARATRLKSPETMDQRCDGSYFQTSPLIHSLNPQAMVDYRIGTPTPSLFSSHLCYLRILSLRSQLLLPSLLGMLRHWLSGSAWKRARPAT